MSAPWVADEYGVHSGFLGGRLEHPSPRAIALQSHPQRPVPTGGCLQGRHRVLQGRLQGHAAELVLVHGAQLHPLCHELPGGVQGGEQVGDGGGWVDGKDACSRHGHVRAALLSVLEHMMLKHMMLEAHDVGST